MPLKSELQLIHEAVGDLALEYELQYPSALDRTARVCPWLRSVEPDLFYALVPYHKDARTVVAREHGYRDWIELAADHGEPDETLYAGLDDNQRTALGFGGKFDFAPGSEADSSIAICILWLSLARNIHLIEPLAAAAGPRFWLQTPSLLRRLIEAAAPLESIEFCLKQVKAPDWEFCARFAYRLGRDDIVEAMRTADDLPALTDLDMLLEACSKLDDEEVEAWLFRSPKLWVEDPLEVWRTASHWAALGMTEVLNMALEVGLKHPGFEPYWCSPLHHAAWGADPAVIQACLNLGCPVHSQDRKYLSTPLGWLIRAQSLSPDGRTSMPSIDALASGKLLVEQGGVLMPSHLFCPNKDLVDNLITI